MRTLILSFTLLLFFKSYTQENITYQKPSQQILDLVDFERPPSVIYDDNKNYLVFLYRDNYQSIEDLSQEELRLAGLRINPKTNIGSRVSFYNNIKIKSLKDDNEKVNEISGLPRKPKISNLNWSPDQSKIAFTNTTEEGVYLWILDLSKSEVRKVSELKLNANIGSVINWLSDSNSMIIKVLPENRSKIINSGSVIPSGPTVSTNFEIGRASCRERV